MAWPFPRERKGAMLILRQSTSLFLSYSDHLGKSRKYSYRNTPRTFLHLLRAATGTRNLPRPMTKIGTIGKNAGDEANYTLNSNVRILYHRCSKHRDTAG
ncbi:hypothetical protein BS78_04G316600 [Paspalum vaginatum]|nr:hypothetical protein BS78_04G316600 [Paspalum vaginatum]